ncbi:MAG: Fic family protein [Gammaproteobacteria bacterium]|nr:Fic family protein [Gammaproteobacteria bacterium]MYH85656.1 Fic family protein [Gammaproteobacteria bacterium]MYK05801.1 Fic family protein [Gammaproteobacteria bacterium]
MDGELLKALAAASTALGRLEGVAHIFPDKMLLIYSYVRKEAVLSSQIEGTQSSLSDLLLSEFDAVPGVPRHDTLEVSNCVAALDHGIRQVREGFPLSNRLFWEIHEILLSSGRGSKMLPGEYRKSQNWIGGSRPGNAHFVPPPHTEVSDCMAALERFINEENKSLPPLIRAALAHVQFETIHPFLDGNGRVGRILITLLLYAESVLSEPLLYLSLYFKQHRETYYELLNRTRQDGDWEAWLLFFLEGVAVIANNAFEAADRLNRLFREDREKISTTAKQRANSALRVHEVLMERPLISLPYACEKINLTFRTAAKAMEVLVLLGIAEEVTGRARNRLFVYRKYIDTLNEEI